LQAGDAGSNPARSTHWECCRMVGNWSRKPGGALRRGSIPPLPARQRKGGREADRAWVLTRRPKRSAGSNPALSSKQNDEMAERQRQRAADPPSPVRLRISSQECGWSWVGSALPRHGRARGFDPRHPLSRTCGRMVRRLPSKQSHAGSIPVTCSVLMRVMPSEASRLITCGHSQGAHPWPATNDPPGRRGPTRKTCRFESCRWSQNSLVAQR
jgi:hypothetical protein